MEYEKYKSIKMAALCLAKAKDYQDMALKYMEDFEGEIERLKEAAKKELEERVYESE